LKNYSGRLACNRRGRRRPPRCIPLPPTVGKIKLRSLLRILLSLRSELVRRCWAAAPVRRERAGTGGRTEATYRRRGARGLRWRGPHHCKTGHRQLILILFFPRTAEILDAIRWSAVPLIPFLARARLYSALPEGGRASVMAVAA
jgi:hypothetical protein